jgi:hypothetical protein
VHALENPAAGNVNGDVVPLKCTNTFSPSYTACSQFNVKEEKHYLVLSILSYTARCSLTIEAGARLRRRKLSENGILCHLWLLNEEVA